MKEVISALPDPLKDRVVNSIVPPPCREMKVLDFFKDSKIKR